MAASKYIFKQRNLFVILSLLMISILMIELSGFSGIFSHSKELNSNNNEYLQPIAIIYPKQAVEETDFNNNKYKYHLHKDWFNANKWPKDYCPYYENICIYNQQLRVFNKDSEFSFNGTKASKVFGDHMPNTKQALPIYLRILNATIWKDNEYSQANCRYNNIVNHMIIQGFFQTMLGEWYARVLSELYRFYYYKNETYFINSEIKLYLFIGDQTPLYTSHHLFMQPYSNYNLQHFTNLIERIDCNCFKRLIFCCFKRNIINNNTYLYE
eukprot:52703_1